jgi:AraC-like DNA-binding protein
VKQNNCHFTLHLAKLRPAEPWSCKGQGLEYVFMKDGLCEYVFGTLRRPLSPGGLMVINQSKPGSLRAINGGESSFWHFSSALDHIAPLFAGHEVCMLPSLIERLKTTKVYPPSTNLARECHKLLAETPAMPSLSQRGHLLRIIAVILSEELQCAEIKTSACSRAEDRMLQAFGNLSAEDLLTVSVEKLACQMGCSRRHLARLFRQHFGTSLLALRTEMRLLKAASLLRNPATKMLCVAHESGFTHLGLFHHSFKKRFGASPGSWRKANA